VSAQENNDATEATSPPPVEEPAPWEGVRFGLKAGATWSTLRGELTFDDTGNVPFSGDFGFAVGASVEIPISRKLSIQPAAFMVRKFSQIELKVPEVVERQKLGVNYLELPLLIKWYPGNRSGVQGNLAIGAMPSFRMGATREIRTGNAVADVDADSLVNEVDWAIVVGGGFEFAELWGAFTVDLRYSHGLRNIAAAEDAGPARWSVVQMVVGITR
jgi:hypothetical protein